MRLAQLTLSNPQTTMPGFFPEFEHETATSFHHVLRILDEKSDNTTTKGRLFEELVKAFLEEDKVQSARFDRVWTWIDWPGNNGELDTGVDLVARERGSGNLVGIQCKFYKPDGTIGLEQLNKFLAKYSTKPFSSGIFVSTCSRWGRNAENALRNRDKPVVRWGPEIFERSSIEWSNFSLTRPKALTKKGTKDIREYQTQALEDVLKGFGDHDRGKLIMACGSGKTFTALRIAEQVAGIGGNVLFLTPSISLLSQSLVDWSIDADLPIKTFAVCSDPKAGKVSSNLEDVSPYDLTEPASTDIDTLTQRFNQSGRDQTMTAIFSTYQSLDVVSEAQKNGLPEFDLIVCDEAHRTTGVKGTKLAGKDESNFQKVHDNDFIKSRKRLYMTATPRIYGDNAKRKADDQRLTLASMDDEEFYGPEFHRLGFGKAIGLGILSDYKVLIFDVDQEQVGIDLDSLLSDSNTKVDMDNGARMVGCWNGLRKRGAEGVEFENDPQPARRAVAFSNTIAQSQLFEKYFPQVIENCITAGTQGAAENPITCDVRHVDGTQHALARSEHLSWLRMDPDDGVCKILTNARCLTEGIDVPALDAILFLHPRRSEIDVVQAVGRVMRKSKGKECGYIIIPIARPPNTSPQEAIASGAYNTVWQVINAITAHDDRFEAKVNQLKLTSETNIIDDYLKDVDIGTKVDDPEQLELPIVISGSHELRDAILARVVDKYSNPRYWEEWAVNIRQIAERHEARIHALLKLPKTGVRPIFEKYLAGVRQNLNDGITEDEAIGMLSQHLVTKPVFDALFEDYAFAGHNPVSLSMQEMILSLQERGLEKETEGLENFYRDVRIRAQGVATGAGKQQIVADLYQRFLKHALPETASSLGIVYTPTEVVDYIIHCVEKVLNKEFSVSVSDEGVHVLDPFVGTGTFITRLLQSGLIRNRDLSRKYAEELHANDIMLLAYYIAAINIEAVYHDRSEATEYEPFNGIVLTDTFQSYEQDDPMDEVLFPRNNARIERQKALDIRVIMGNPPWSATNNRAYPTIDARVRSQYAEPASQVNVNRLYDPYVKALRWASDRVQNSANGGIVAFVTNGGFIDSNSFDGFRKAVAQEFHSVYCFDLRGDQRTAGEQSRKEGGKIFGSGSRASVAILLLVKKPGKSPGAVIHYRDIGDYLSREQKLAILSSPLANFDWETIKPNSVGDWVNQRSDSFPKLTPLVASSKTTIDLEAPIFKERTLGLVTSRDAWCFNSSDPKLRENVEEFIESYNKLVERFQSSNRAGNLAARVKSAKEFTAQAKVNIPLARANYHNIANGERYSVDDSGFTVSSYRPFFRQNLYANRSLNDNIRKFPEIFPFPNSGNLGISLTGVGSNTAFHALMTDNIAEYCLTAVNSVYLSRYRFIPAPDLLLRSDTEDTEWERISNINPASLVEFRQYYSDEGITEDDLFYYTYGVLHSDQWRRTFASDLVKSHARIPKAVNKNDFQDFVEAGRKLAQLHVNYESIETFPLHEIHSENWDEKARDAFRVQKMVYGGKARNLDRTEIAYNAGITLSGIPAQAHAYRMGSRSALDWLIDRYQVRTDKKSGIINDPNDWAAEQGNPRYIIDLVKRITTVSVRTVDIVARLPQLPI